MGALNGGWLSRYSPELLLDNVVAAILWLPEIIEHKDNTT